VNYYGLVRPQIDFRNSIQGLNTAVTSLQLAPVAQVGEELPTVTGHASSFMTERKYFVTRGTPATATGQGGIRPQAGPLQTAPLTGAQPVPRTR
jgi:hypothetical protein